MPPAKKLKVVGVMARQVDVANVVEPVVQVTAAGVVAKLVDAAKVVVGEPAEQVLVQF